ncbi:hypothetical protein SUGI_0953740 [Cryptomeria japonica]|nr:hypothetical protein SUGI_0953740 [Cryptomeria japonica]
MNNALLHLDARLRHLYLEVALDDPKAVDINNWIRLAAEKQVERMDIHITYRDRKTRLNTSSMVELRDSIFRCENLTALIGNYIDLPKVPTNFGVLRSLKTLYFMEIRNVDDAMFEGFIDLCPYLRILGICDCLGLKNLNIRSSKLMYLNLGIVRHDIC